MSPADVAVVTQDPRFGGGVASQIQAFWRGTVALGRRPRLLYLSRATGISVARRSASIGRRSEHQGELEATAYPSLLPELDAFNQVVGGWRAAGEVRAARTAWVAATTASFGWPAARSRRAYAAWIGTGQDDEWRSRRHALPTSRRIALAANRPVLLRLEREVLRRATALYATSARSCEVLSDVAGRDVRVIPIPVDLDEFAPEPDDEWLARLHAPTIAFVGRASDPRKNVALLVAAFEAVRRQLPQARVELIGEPPRAPVPPGIEAVGHVGAVAARLRRASLFVLPSRQEGFGIVVAEALASGVPVVVTPSGGPETLVRESGGGVVTTGFDAEELAAEILSLLGDHERLLALRRAGRVHVEREHSYTRFGELLGAAYRELDAG